MHETARAPTDADITGDLRVEAATRCRKLLLVMPFPPRQDASHGGARVAASIVAELSARHLLAVLYLRGHDEAGMDPGLVRRCATVEEIPRRGSCFTDTLLRVRSRLRGDPTWVTHTMSSLMTSRVRQVAQEFHPDIVQFEYHVMGQYAGMLQGLTMPRVLTEYEPGTLAADEHLARAARWSHLGSWLERRAWRTFERRVISQMDAVIAFTERDQQALQRLGAAPPIVRIPFRLTTGATMTDNAVTRDERTLLFVGNFAHPPNVEAADRLIKSIFPAVRAQAPRARLQLVGANLPSALRATRQDGVSVVGEVADVSPFLEQAALVVVPLSLGGGMRVKVVEALAAGATVVASPRAVEGLQVRDNVQLAIAQSDDDFVCEIVSLLRDARRRQRLAAAARAWARHTQTSDAWMAEYDKLYATLLQR